MTTHHVRVHQSVLAAVEKRLLVRMAGRLPRWINSDHLTLIALAAMYVGVPYAPIAPAYSLQAQEFSALRQVFERMRPGLIFADDGARFERALRDVMPADVELVTTRSVPAGMPATPFESPSPTGSPWAASV